MEYISFGKVAIKIDQIDNFIQEAQSKGLSVRPVEANIYEFGVTVPTLHDVNALRKTAGMIGLKYAQP